LRQLLRNTASRFAFSTHGKAKTNALNRTAVFILSSPHSGSTWTGYVSHRAAPKRSKDGPQARRLLAVAAIYDGATRTEAAKIGGVGLQVVRDWVVKFNAQGPDGLIDRKAPGQPPRLNDVHRAALAAIIESGPIPAIHGVVRWRIVDLCQWIFEEFRIVVSEQTLSRVLRKMDYRKLSARPRHHAQAEGAIEDFKKVFPSAWKRSAARRASLPTP
jgi:transposase